MVMRAFPIEGGQPGEVDWRLVCPKGCQPGGHVSEWYVEDRRLHDQFDYIRVVSDYPDLGPPPLTPEELRSVKDALGWGEEEGHASGIGEKRESDVPNQCG
jgi:hypothetical protein